MIRIRWGTMSLLAAGALLVPAAGAHACLVDAIGMKNPAGDGTNLNPGEPLTVTGERLGSEAGPGEPVTFSAYIKEEGHEEVLLSLADKEPVPANGRLAKPFPLGDLGDRPRDLKLYVDVEHSGTSFKLAPRPFTYMKPTQAAPAEPADPAAPTDPPPVDSPSLTPLAPVPGDKQPQTPTSGSPSAPPPAGNGPTESGPPVGPPPDPGQPGGRQTAHHATAPAHARSHDAGAGAPEPEIQVARAARAPKLAGPAAPTHAKPAERTLAAPRTERADGAAVPSSLPRGVAAEPDQAVDTDLPAVIVATLLAAGIALLLRSRRRPTDRAAIVPAPLPPRLPTTTAAEVLTGDPPATKLPDPAEVEAELQELLAEHAAKTARETPRNGPLAGAR